MITCSLREQLRRKQNTTTMMLLLSIWRLDGKRQKCCNQLTKMRDMLKHRAADLYMYRQNTATVTKPSIRIVYESIRVDFQ